eukprot:RCo011684
MVLQTEATGAMGNPAPFKRVTKAQLAAAKELLDISAKAGRHLTFQDLGRGRAGRGTILEGPEKVRIDKQGQTSSDEANIQIQVGELGTIATVLVPNRLILGQFSDADQKKILEAAVNGLVRSLGTYERESPQNYRVTGDP